MRNNFLIRVSIFLGLIILSVSTAQTAAQKDGLLKIHFLDVGQGDAIFIEAPNGNQVLIDGGPGSKVLAELGEVMPFYDHDIDVVLLTHSDADHAAGLIEVLDRYEVRNIVYSNIVRDAPLYRAWQTAVAKESANIIEPVAGWVLDLGNGVNLAILHPFQSLAGEVRSKVNNDSVVAMLKYGEMEVLLTGDIEAKAERQILLSGLNLDADILKVAHHGSKTSTLEEFLAEVSPQLVVIQVGAKNRYGHPALPVLTRLENHGIKYYRTDEHGTVSILTDGNFFTVHAQKEN